ncbi:hypothetical protein PROFUN_14069 [Planoprotostelium fungivorum]|uniref:ASX DEUBAD domain-containing protein n=1 Tax=Planoprotostelium fungivorum TaxID=1890364 RepID=A0A2P6N1Z6_9EUKA|nr:hypothetical protein PROFUN_14069 [Planoprotostelium fungivorum]
MATATTILASVDAEPPATHQIISSIASTSIRQDILSTGTDSPQSLSKRNTILRHFVSHDPWKADTSKLKKSDLFIQEWSPLSSYTILKSLATSDNFKKLSPDERDFLLQFLPARERNDGDVDRLFHHPDFQQCLYYYSIMMKQGQFHPKSRGYIEREREESWGNDGGWKKRLFDDYWGDLLRFNYTKETKK